MVNEISGAMSDLGNPVEKMTVDTKNIREEIYYLENTFSATLEKFTKFNYYSDEDVVGKFEEAIEAHKNWVKKLEVVITSGEYDIETDHHKYAFGIFYSSYKPPVELEKLWKKIDKLHERPSQ